MLGSATLVRIVLVLLVAASLAAACAGWAWDGVAVDNPSSGYDGSALVDG